VQSRSVQAKTSHRNVAITILLVLAVLVPLGSLVGRVDALCAQTHWGECEYTWGYVNPNQLGWLVPANTTIFTPLLTNASVSNWIQGEVTLFPYNVSRFTEMNLGLYISGKLVASATSQNLSMSGAGGYNGVCSGGDCVGGYGGSCGLGACGPHMLMSISPDLAVFTNWTWEVGIYHTFGWPGIPSGSTLAMALETSKPVWVSIDNQSSGFSYLQRNPSFTSLPGASPSYDTKSPHTVAAWVYSTNPNAPGGPRGPFYFLMSLSPLVVLGIVSSVAAVAAYAVIHRIRTKRSSDNDA